MTDDHNGLTQRRSIGDWLDSHEDSRRSGDFGTAWRVNRPSLSNFDRSQTLSIVMCCAHMVDFRMDRCHCISWITFYANTPMGFMSLFNDRDEKMYIIRFAKSRHCWVLYLTDPRSMPVFPWSSGLHPRRYKPPHSTTFPFPVCRCAIS